MTVATLKRMLNDLPTRLDEAPVNVHVAARDGWALVPLKPQIGRASEDAFVALSCALPDDLEEYAPDSGEHISEPSLRIVK